MPLLGRRVVGNYTITALLGEGGMGAVYLAQHDTLDEKLAIKVLHPQYAARDDIVRRFVAEAKAASATKHPNIVRVFDVGRLDSGEHYMALEYLEGSSFDRVELPLPLADVLAVAVQVCDGLDAAHERGIIHRDLKPGNLFLSPRPGNKLFTKVLDFGIAKLVGDTAEGGVHTRTGVVMGTPSYMSPEQALGSAAVTPLSDVFSLGAILFKLVSGRKPFQAATVGEIVHEQFTRPTPDPGPLVPALPSRWRDIICASLSVAPELRPQGARDVAELLIDATPGGAEIARAVGYRPATGRAPPELRRQNTGPSSDQPTASERGELGRQPTLTAPASTVPARSAGRRSTAPPSGGRRRRRVVIFATIAAIGFGAAILAVTRSSGRPSGPAASAARDADAGALSAGAAAGQASARSSRALTRLDAAEGVAAVRPDAANPTGATSAGAPAASGQFEHAPRAARPPQPRRRHRRPHRRRRDSWQVPKGGGGFAVPRRRSR